MEAFLIQPKQLTQHRNLYNKQNLCYRCNNNPFKVAQQNITDLQLNYAIASKGCIKHKLQGVERKNYV